MFDLEKTGGDCPPPCIENGPVAGAAAGGDGGLSGNRAYRIAGLLPPPTVIPPEPPSTSSGGSLLPLDERVVLVAAFCLEAWVRHRQPVRASDVVASVPALRSVYKTANAVGTLMGKGVAGHGLGLRMQGGAYPPVYWNGHRLLTQLTALQLKRVREQLGFADLAALCEAVRTLPDVQG